MKPRTVLQRMCSLVPGTVPDPEVIPLPRDELFEVLKNPRRRLVLRYLRYTEGAATVGELSDYIAAKESGKEIPDGDPTGFNRPDGGKRKAVYVVLFQNHLIRMASMGAIDYEPDRKIAEPNDVTGKLYPYVRDGL